MQLANLGKKIEGIGLRVPGQYLATVRLYMFSSIKGSYFFLHTWTSQTYKKGQPETFLHPFSQKQSSWLRQGYECITWGIDEQSSIPVPKMPPENSILKDV